MALPRGLNVGSLALVSALVALSGCIAPQGADPGTAAPAVPADDNITIDHTAFDGVLLCAVGAPQAALNPCIGENLFRFDVQAGLKTLLVAVAWDPRTPLAETLQLAIETYGYGDLEETSDEHRYWAGAVTPGEVVRLDNGTAHNPDHDWDAIANRTPLQIRVFPGRTVPPSVVVDQAFTVHTAAVYGARAPAETSPVPAA